ncbi:MAG TPA: PadR family transcriptional regulator [Gammaproteobacteria bacterium]|nr:PadR family transcriptional regulator [Gammaproteobacteria bacterium]
MHRHFRRPLAGPEAYFFMSRYRGFGHFFGGHRGEGMGGRGFRTGRKLASGDLQLVILSLLADKPRHGYEIIKDVEERSGGFYSPSPGVVYPALTYLEEIEYATVEVEGAKKRYHITDAGRAHLDANRAAADAILAQFDWVSCRMDDVREAFDDGEAGQGDDRHALHREFHRVRQEFKNAVRSRMRAGAEEQQRVLEILKRALAEIHKK